MFVIAIGKLKVPADIYKNKSILSASIYTENR